MAAAHKVNDMSAALKGLRNPAFLRGRKYEEQQWRANREGAHAAILDFEKAFVKRMKALDVPVFAHCVVRTEADQWMLVRNGVSRDTPDDGLWPHRKHAVDIIHSIYGWKITDDQWAVLGHIGKEVAAMRGLRITWGGDWKFYDPAHWELTNWRKMK